MAGGIVGFFLWPEEEVQVQAWPAGITLIGNLQTLPYVQELPMGLQGRGLGAPLYCGWGNRHEGIGFEL